MLLICWMLHPDPKYRAVIQDLQRHTWLTQPVDVQTYSFTEVVGKVSFIIFFYNFIITFTSYQ